MGLRAQQFISGRVRSTGSEQARIPYADLRLADARSTADSTGGFSIESPGEWPATMVISAFGYVSDSLVLNAPPGTPMVITLDPVQELRAAEVVERQSATQLDLRTTTATERIGPRELKRAACCDVSESFETNATVDVSYSDAISGAKTLRMLGLDGKYAQISVENIPFVRGLSSSYGLTLLPGPWIREINVGKGVGTAVNGPNAMTGQIELCLLDPEGAPTLFANLYTNSQGRTELNLNSAQHFQNAGSNLLMVHTALAQRDMDDNGDGFRDQPLTRRFNVMDRWMVHTRRRTSQVVLRYVTDIRDGGQTDAHKVTEGSTGRHYAVNVSNEMADIIAKNGWILADSSRSIGLLGAFRNHTLSSTFGDRGYEAGQLSGYANVVYQQIIGNAGDQWKAGGGLQIDEYKEAFMDTVMVRTERMPGLFTEYTRSRPGNTIVVGVRADFNDVFGTVLSPRLHVKHDLGVLTTMRLSIGSAFRSSLPLIENASALASSRTVRFEGPLGLERSWNIGLSFLHKWKWNGRKWALGVDVYRCDLQQQVVADLDRSPRLMVIHMLHGTSFANSALIDVQVQLSRLLDLKVSYRWYDVRTTYDGSLREKPFNPAHRCLVDLAYESRNKRWRSDITWNIFGSSRLPSTAENPTMYRLSDRSPACSTVNAQLTWIANTFELYAGVENLTGTIQTRQIIAPEDPFGPYFDASMIWGPTNGSMYFTGLRWSVTGRSNKTDH